MGVPEYVHQTVLGPEAVALVAPRPGGLYADLTLGGGGHSLLLLQGSGPDGRVIGLDRDPRALAAAGERLAAFGDRFRSVRSSFSALESVLDGLGLGRLDGLIADLGVSSPQLDVAQRGFSFSRPGPVDMRMGPDVPMTAAELIDGADEAELARILWEYGEERHSRRVARALVRGRPFADTAALSAAVEAAVPGRPGRIHKATRTFQALRIAVNDELGELRALLDALPRVLAPGGRAAVISFHSLEDRLVKRRFRELAGHGAPRDAYGHPIAPPAARALTRKPVSGAEGSANPRARSARLRAIEML